MFVAMAVVLAVVAICCGVNVPLGVDPKSDAADIHADAGPGN
jgi:hypothetical protein